MDFTSSSIRTQNISFCNKVAINIINSEAKQDIMNVLKNKYNITMKHKYANIINKNTLQYLSKQPHLISIKTGGSNYFLFLTKLENTNVCLFIDRKVKQGYTLPRIISTKFKFNDDLFNDTLMDGELVKDNDNNWMFIISNIIVYKTKIINYNIVDKTNLLYNILKNEYNKDTILDICPLFIKKLFKYNEYNKLITMYIPNLKYSIRGLYFNTLNSKHSNHLFMYPSNNNDSKNFKKFKKINKSPEEKQEQNEVILDKNFVIKNTEQPDIYHLYVMKDGIITYYSIALIQKLKTSKILKKWFNDNTNTSCIVKCKYNTKFSKWEVLDINNDTNIPSNYNNVIKYEN